MPRAKSKSVWKLVFFSPGSPPRRLGLPSGVTEPSLSKTLKQGTLRQAKVPMSTELELSWLRPPLSHPKRGPRDLGSVNAGEAGSFRDGPMRECHGKICPRM